MNQYQNQYGTIFAVKEHNGAPAIMCRAELSETWSLSSMIEPFTPGAWTVEELQAQLDNWAAVKGWQPVEDPAGSETREIVDDEEEEIRATDFCKCRTCKCESCFAHGCAKECPANAEESCLTVNCPEYIERTETTCNCQATVAPTGDAAATMDGSAAVSTAETTTTSESGAGANSCETPAPTAQPSNEPPAELAPTAPMNLPAFDYSGLDVVTVDTLHLAENIIRSARQKYIVDLAGAVDMAHEELVRNSDGHNQHTEETFVAWCRSVGISKTTAYQLLQVQALITGATPEEQAVLEAASPSLLYAAAKPSAPAELVQAVKDGDITTHKQYQEALAEIRARDAKINDLLEMSEAADRRADKAEQAAKDTARERDAALRRAAEAEKQRDGARDALQAAKLRSDKWQAEAEALKAQPVEAQVVDEEEIDRRAKERAGELTAPLREELEALRARHPADPEEAEQAMRDAYDSTLYTGRAIENAWRTLRPLLSCLDAARREQALRQLNKTISQIQGEIVQCL